MQHIYAWSCVLFCLTRNSPHKKDTAFFVCFYFTSLCPAEFCLCQLLPLCSFGAVMPSRKVVALGSSLQSQWDGKGLVWRWKGYFPGCFWKIAHVFAYYADTLEFLVYYRDWTWLEKSCSVLCPGNHIFKISTKKKKKTIEVLFFTSSHSYFSLSLPCPFSSKKLIVCRDKTERWSVVCDEENSLLLLTELDFQSQLFITEGYLGMENPIHLGSWEQR